MSVRIVTVMEEADQASEKHLEKAQVGCPKGG